MKNISALTLLFGTSLHAITPQQREFFESKIRPILAQECYECHSEATKQKGNLVLDSRPGWQKGGDNGDAIRPGDPAQSLLMRTLRHEIDDLQMPKNGAKLDARTLADFEHWISDGAPDPRDTAPTKEQIAKETDWSAILKRRKQWWSFAPLATHSPERSIDSFIDAALQKEGLKAAAPADNSTLKRRLSYVLTGLPPADAKILNLKSEIDSLLASPRFGEKWARHMMDWLRYAESYGSEGDPVIPYAHRYRDYLIRAFNEDVPWPQMVKEAIAGDLLPNPRLKDGVNESAIGIAQLRMVLHGFSPVDSLDEMVTFTDNQIDTVTKAFQALTVSCARCHNHKFDAISQADFYALYGIFTSTHPAVIDANAPGTGDAIRTELRSIKKSIKEAMISLPDSQNRPESKELPGQKWHGLPHTPAGEFSITEKGIRIHPAGYVSDTISQRDRAVLYTDRFKCEGGTLWFRIAGNGGVKAKYVVQNYPRTGTIHKAIELKEPKDEKLAWRSLDLDFWKGDEIFLQVTTAADMPAEHKSDAPSWFVLTDTQITQDKTAPPSPKPSTATPEQLLTAWRSGTLSDSDAEALNEYLQKQPLPSSVIALIQKYHALEKTLPSPTRVPGVIEADAKDAALFTRGDHKLPAESIPRRFLEALDSTPFQTTQSGRLELAERMADMRSNPLTARVIVNRVWHHVFGRGIAASTDNFGKLGELPSHPELLDHLANEFISSGGSIKSLLRSILLSRAFQRSASSEIKNPKSDIYLAHWPLRRLDAEAIRDSILTLSGRLDTQMFGDSVSGGEPRRSVYVKVIRNALDPFLTTFDAPVPVATRGVRDQTNVPAQSLTLLNDPNILRWAADWAVQSQSVIHDESRVRQMWQQAFSRDPSEAEINQSLVYLKELFSQHEDNKHRHAMESKRADDLSHQIASVLDPVRESLLKKRQQPLLPADLPSPLAEWLFDGDLKDTRGKLDLQAVGNARVENGALVVDGSSMAESGSLPKKLRAKTLEAWVMLDDLNQQGGGVLTVQGKDGVVFDSLVFGEKNAGHWVAGSDHFERSEPFEGNQETEATNRPVHVAIVYQPDGSVNGYRDGRPYGRTYRKAPGATFEAESSQILLGCRHGAPSGNRGLHGRIFRARLYDRALTQEEIVQTARIESATLTEYDILAALTKEQRHQIENLRSQREAILQNLSPIHEDSKLQAWTLLAQSFINMKEFIYLR